jgi:hypothetical protein
VILTGFELGYPVHLGLNIYVNNRLEGNALGTIAAILEMIESEPAQAYNWI